MSRSKLPAALAAALIAGTAVYVVRAQTIEPAPGAYQTPRTITVSGSGHSQMIPDVAVVQLGVNSDGGTPRDALDKNNTTMKTVIDGLKTLGLGVTDIQTSGLTLTARYDNSGNVPRLIGYQASNNLTLRVKDMSRLGDILDMTVSNGANQINGLSFDVQNNEQATNEARVAAMKDARAKAELMATALGAMVGKPITISESYGSYNEPVAQQTMNAAMATVPIASGQVGLSASVSVVFELN